MKIRKNNKQILLLANHSIGVYKLRLEIIEKLLEEGYEVCLSIPYGEANKKLEELGCRIIETRLERRGKNILKELQLLNCYRKQIREVRPDIILTYTIKPNLYGAFWAARYRIPCLANITGLGSAVENGNRMKKLVLGMYRLAFQKIEVVFFQNKENMRFFEEHRLPAGKTVLLPGSGVNLSGYPLQEMPEGEAVVFAYIGRVMKEKGIDEYLQAADYIRKHYPYTRFHVCGFCEEGYQEKLEEYESRGIICFHGMVKEISDFLKQCHAVVLPSYHEGMANSLLEAAACGRIIIASDISGCREAFEEGRTGFGFQAGNWNSLAEAIERFLSLTPGERLEMGLAGRRKMEMGFDRRIVVDAYMSEIQRLTEKRRNE